MIRLLLRIAGAFSILGTTNSILDTSAFAQNRAANYVQVTNVEASPEPLHVQSNSCGTATVAVFRFRNRGPDTVVTVSMDMYSGRPPGVSISVMPEKQTKTISSPASSALFSFKICAAGKVTGSATVIAIIERAEWKDAGPDEKYEIRAADAGEQARANFTIVE